MHVVQIGQQLVGTAVEIRAVEISVVETRDQLGCLVEIRAVEISVVETRDQQGCLVETRDQQGCLVETRDQQGCLVETRDQQGCLVETEGGRPLAGDAAHRDHAKRPVAPSDPAHHTEAEE